MQSDLLTANMSVPQLCGKNSLPLEADLSTRRTEMRTIVRRMTPGLVRQTIFRPVLLYYAIPAAGVGVMGGAAWLGSNKLAAYGLMIVLGGCALGGLAADED